MKIVRYIKIRIGEPLTALGLCNNGVAFGSISGYIGFYSYRAQEVFYIREVFEELIRSIQFRDSNVAFACIGDESGVIINFEDPTKIKYEIIQYLKTHNISQCPNTIPFLKKNVCLLMPFPSTNAKRPKEENGVEADIKQNAWLIDFNSKDQTDLGHISIGSYSVPFDFDRGRLLWLQYHENKEKSLVAFDINTRKTDTLYNFTPRSNYEFVSFAKWYQDRIILVKNQKIVQLFDPYNDKTVTLYEHKSHIVALNIFIPDSEDDKPQFDINSRHEEEKISVSNKISKEYPVIVSIDYKEGLYYFNGGELSQTLSIRRLDGFPVLPKNSYLFDMGYPYYISIDSKHITFTSDMGLFVLENSLG